MGRPSACAFWKREAETTRKLPPVHVPDPARDLERASYPAVRIRLLVVTQPLTHGERQDMNIDRNVAAPWR